ncbi:MAG TPA: GAP family protein [Gaiellales bacterium]|jgi:cytochrome c biogenesis protein CcdA|nr:GAP family protein [Gaiellales bacterium]
MSDVLALALLVVSVGLVDSLNPGTILPALYLATGDHAARRMLRFAAGVVAVNLLAGVALLAGPGQLVLANLPHAGARTRHFAELALAAALLLAAGLAWWARDAIRDRFARPSRSPNRGPLLFGATVALVELPTALPYFAVIAAVSGSRASFLTQVVMLGLFNLAFIAPIIVIAALSRASHDSVALRIRIRALLLAHVGELIAGLLLAIAVALAVVGTLGFAR